MSLRESLDCAYQMHDDSSGGKYSSRMAAYLYGLWLDGDTGDEEWDDEGGVVVTRYGRHLLITDDLGFVCNGKVDDE